MEAARLTVDNVLPLLNTSLHLGHYHKKYPSVAHDKKEMTERKFCPTNPGDSLSLKVVVLQKTFGRGCYAVRVMVLFVAANFLKLRVPTALHP